MLEEGEVGEVVLGREESIHLALGHVFHASKELGFGDLGWPIRVNAEHVTRLIRQLSLRAWRYAIFSS
jgi:hypothetical protein